uniref:Uncharacterized protein n=1 Tax=Populus trichocarpa TaxID=3694 RepID=A0A2K1YG26_POPTR
MQSQVHKSCRCFQASIGFYFILYSPRTYSWGLLYNDGLERTSRYRQLKRSGCCMVDISMKQGIVKQINLVVYCF